jgi:RNA polymerase-binding transcription factor DksA
MAENDMDKAISSGLRDDLTTRCAELFDLRDSLKESYQRMSEPVTELVESASKTSMSAQIHQRIEDIYAEIRNIDRALKRMTEGDYGCCLACRRPIRVKRLQALPWTDYCVKCAGMREVFYSGSIESHGNSDDEGNYNDDELRATILSDLSIDGRIETQELVITCEDGVVYLEGFLPSVTKYQMMLDILQDIPGVADIVDGIGIDQRPWERCKQHPDGHESDQSAEDLVGEEADADIDPYTSFQTGEPMTPAG